MEKKDLRILYWNNTETIECIAIVLEASRTLNEHRLSLVIPQLTKCLKNSVDGILNNFDSLMEYGLQWDANELGSVLIELEQAQEMQDYILMADLYELRLQPMLWEVQDAIRLSGINLKKPEWLEMNLMVVKTKNPTLYQAIKDYIDGKIESVLSEKQYIIEPTSVGRVTMAIEADGKRWYLHSNVNPVIEARQFANRVYQVEKTKYLLLGFGLGYHVTELLKIYDDIDIVVVEPDIRILYEALSNCDYQELLNKVAIVYDPEWKQFIEYMEDRELVLFRPELRYIQNEYVKNKLLELANRQDSIEDFRMIFYQNARENIKNCDAYVDEIETNIKGKKVVIVAGGPSLDKNIENLRKKNDEIVIIAVGTVYKLLLKKKIDIDYVVVSDSFIYPQIQGIETERIPILILSTADRRVGKFYQGKKYLVCQKGYSYSANYAEKNGYMCYDSGGSVATLALDIAIRLQAKSIGFIGLDLAYYGNRAHATGTAQETYEGYRHRMVEGVDGSMLNTSYVFIQYKEWMERRIQEDDVTMSIIDATEGGAKKKGFQIMTLCDFLKCS